VASFVRDRHGCRGAGALHDLAQAHADGRRGDDERIGDHQDVRRGDVRRDLGGGLVLIVEVEFGPLLHPPQPHLRLPARIPFFDRRMVEPRIEHRDRHAARSLQGTKARYPAV